MQPVIDALAAYSATEGAYPDSVNVLIPSYLAELPGKPDWARRTESWWRYEKGEGEYEGEYVIQFEYAGPGYNMCLYDPISSDWSCVGRY